MAVTTSCGGAYRYDSRLAAVDSLMHDLPDSALALVQAVDPASLTREGDRAYHDLLLTQARYRCYITATSDSDINRALNYYRRHDGEREKLTRAYIYKGAVMEELGHPDSAMLYYKHAEATAAPTDYFNLGYVNMRMGSLYTDYYAYDGMGINKFESALSFFNRIETPEYQHKCLNNLGCLYRETHPLKAERLLSDALDICYQSNDTDGMIADYHSLIVLYYYNKKYERARQLIWSINKFGEPLDLSYYTSAANVYSGLGMADSATVFLDLAKKIGFKDEEEKAFYLESLSKVALVRNDTINYMRYQNESNHITDSLLKYSKKMLISRAEIEYDDNAHYRKSIRQQKVKLTIISISIFVLLAFIALILLYLLKLKNYQKIISEIKTESEEQLKSFNHLNQVINKLKIDDIQLKKFVNKQLEMLRDITVACYHEPHNKLGKQVKDILQFNAQNQGDWQGLYSYIDAEYDSIMSRTQQEYPQLNEKELLLLALTCLGFSYIQIAIIMGYSNHTSISTLKQRVASKMGLKGTLNDYVDRFVKS